MSTSTVYVLELTRKEAQQVADALYFHDITGPLVSNETQAVLDELESVGVKPNYELDFQNESK